jgi:hypothetical protein
VSGDAGKAAARRQVFIVGCARTGSTLLRQILNRSDHVAIASETQFMRWSAATGLSRLLEAARAAPAADQPRAVERIVDAFYADGAWKWTGRHVPRQVFMEHVSTSDLTGRAMFGLLMRLFADAQGDPPGRIHWEGDKTPNHLYSIPTLVKWFPDAVILHTFRDPRGIYHSELRRRRDGRWGLKAHLPWLPDAIADPIMAPVETVHTTLRWRQAVRLHWQYQARLAGRYLLVRFEELITNTPDTIRNVCDMLEVPFTDELLAEVRVVGSSFDPQRRGSSGIKAEATNRWRSDIDPFARVWFSTALSSELKAFGYEP